MTDPERIFFSLFLKNDPDLSGRRCQEPLFQAGIFAQIKFGMTNGDQGGIQGFTGFPGGDSAEQPVHSGGIVTVQQFKKVFCIMFRREQHSTAMIPEIRPSDRNIQAIFCSPDNSPHSSVSGKDSGMCTRQGKIPFYAFCLRNHFFYIRK